VLDYCDRAILKTYLYTGVRLATACRLHVRDFHLDGDEATLTINEKGNPHHTIGIHFVAAESISEYIAKTALESGPLFRDRRAPRAKELGEQPMSEASMYRVVADYLARLPGAVDLPEFGMQSTTQPLAFGATHPFPSGCSFNGDIKCLALLIRLISYNT
jgi:integrase